MSWPYDYYYTHGSSYNPQPFDFQIPIPTATTSRQSASNTVHAATVLDTDTDNDNEEPQRFTYTLKIFKTNKKSKFSIQKIRRYELFKTPEDLRSYIRSEFSDLVLETSFDVGYYKGRGSGKVWLTDEEDMKCMYKELSGHDISLWCEGKHEDDVDAATGSKRKAVSQEPRPSKRHAIREEVDDLFAELQEKHGSHFTAAQLRLWANMLQVGTHRDTDNPPKVPMFGLNKTSSKGGGALNDALTSVAEGFMRALKSPSQPAPGSNTPPHAQAPRSIRPALDEIGVSPGKCAVLRSQYIEQLKQLHQLLELTALTKEEYDEQKATILKKMQVL